MPLITSPFKENPKKALKENIKSAAKTYFSTFSETDKKSLIGYINNAFSHNNKIEDYEIIELLRSEIPDFEQFKTNKKNDYCKVEEKKKFEVRQPTTLNLGFNENIPFLETLSEDSNSVSVYLNEEKTPAEGIIKQAITIEGEEYRKKQNEETEKLRSSLEELAEKTKDGKLGGDASYKVTREVNGEKTIFEIVNSKNKDLAPKYSVIIFEDGALTRGYLNKDQKFEIKTDKKLLEELNNLEKNSNYEEESESEEDEKSEKQNKTIQQNTKGISIGVNQKNTTYELVGLDGSNLNLSNAIQVNQQDLEEISLGKNGETSIEGYKKLIGEVKEHRKNVKEGDKSQNDQLKEILKKIVGKSVGVGVAGEVTFHSGPFENDENQFEDASYKIKTSRTKLGGLSFEIEQETIKKDDDKTTEKKYTKLVFKPGKTAVGYYDLETKDDSQLKRISSEEDKKNFRKILDIIEKTKEKDLEIKEQNAATEPLKKLLEEMYNKGKEVDGQNDREFSRLYVLNTEGNIDQALGTQTYIIRKIEPNAGNDNKNTYSVTKFIYNQDNQIQNGGGVFSKIVFQPNRKTIGYLNLENVQDGSEKDLTQKEEENNISQFINEFKPIVDKKRPSSIEEQEKSDDIKNLTKNLEELVEIYGTDENHPQRKKLENLPAQNAGVEGTYSYKVTKTAPSKANGEKTTYNIKRIHKGNDGNEIADEARYYKLELQKGQKAKGFIENGSQTAAYAELTNQQVDQLSNFVTGIKTAKDADKSVSIGKKETLKSELNKLLDGENSKIITIGKTDGKFITYKITKDRFFDKYELEKIDRDDTNEANIDYTSLDFSGERIKGYLNQNPKPENYDYVNQNEIAGYETLLRDFKTAAVQSNLQNLVKDGESKTIRINDNDDNHSVTISRGTDEIGKKRRVFQALVNVVGEANINDALNGLLVNPVGGDNYNDLNAAKTAVLALNENNPDYNQNQKKDIIKRKTAFNALVDLCVDDLNDGANGADVKLKANIAGGGAHANLGDARTALNTVQSEEFYVFDPSKNSGTDNSHSKLKFNNEGNVSKLTGYFLDSDDENAALATIEENNPNPNGILDTLFTRTSDYLEDNKKEAKNNKSAVDSFKKTLEDLHSKNAELKYLPTLETNDRNINAVSGTDSYEITKNENDGETTFTITKTHRNGDRTFIDDETRYSIYRFDADGKVRGFSNSEINPDNFVEAAKLMRDLEPEEVKILGLKSKKITNDNIEKIIHQREIAIEQKKATKELKDALETQLGKYNSNNTSLQNLPILNDNGVVDPSKGTDSYVISKDENQGNTNYQIRKTHKLGAVQTVTYSKYQFDPSGGVRFFENQDENHALTTLAVEANDTNLTLNEKKIGQAVIYNVKNITEDRSKKKAILAPTKTIEEVIRDNIVEIALRPNDPSDGNPAHANADDIIAVLQGEEGSKKLADDLMQAGYKKLNEEQIRNAIKPTELVNLINVKRTEAGLNGNNLAADSLDNINNNNALYIAVFNYIKTPDVIKDIVEEGTAFKTKLLSRDEDYRKNFRAGGLVARKEDLIKALVDADLTPNKAQIIASIDKITDEANFSVGGINKRERVTNRPAINGEGHQHGLAQEIANVLPVLKPVKDAAVNFANDNTQANANAIATAINTALDNRNPTSDQIAMAVVSGLKGLVNVIEFNDTKRDDAVTSLGLGDDRKNTIKAIWNKAQYQLEQDPKNWLVEGGVAKNLGKTANRVFGGTKIEIAGTEILNTQKNVDDIVRDYVKEIVHSLPLGANAGAIAGALKRGNAQGVEHVTGSPIDKLTSALVKNGHWEKNSLVFTKLTQTALDALAGNAVAVIVNEIRPDIEAADIEGPIGDVNAADSLGKMVQDKVEQTYRLHTTAGKGETIGELVAGAVAIGAAGVAGAVGLASTTVAGAGTVGLASATVAGAGAVGLASIAPVGIGYGIKKGYDKYNEQVPAADIIQKEPEETLKPETQPKKLSPKQIQENENKQKYAKKLRTEIDEKLSALNRLTSFSHNSTTFSVKEEDGSENKVTYKIKTKDNKVEYLITKTKEHNKETYSKLVFSKENGQYLGGYKDKHTSEKQDSDLTVDKIKKLSTELYAFHNKEVFNYDKNLDAKKIELSPYAIRKSLEFKLDSTDSKEYSFKKNGEENKLKIEKQIDENLGRVKYLITKQVGGEKPLFTVLSFDKETEKFIGGFKDKEQSFGDKDKNIDKKFKDIISEINNFEKKAAEQEKSNSRAKENSAVLDKRKPNSVGEDFVAESPEVKRQKLNSGDRNVINRDSSEENVVNQTQTNEVSEKRKISLKEWTGGTIQDREIKESYKFIESKLNEEVKEVSFHKSGFAKTDLSKIIENGAKFRTCVFAKGCDLGDLTKLDPDNFTNCRFHESLLENLKGDDLEKFKQKFEITGEKNAKGYYTTNIPNNSVENAEASQLKNARVNSRSS